MIEHIEARWPQPLLVPDTPVQRAVAWLLDAFGSEGLLPAGMHYRWSYRAQQEDFLRAEFGRIAHAGTDRAERRVAGEQLMEYFSGFAAPPGCQRRDAGAGGNWRILELLDALDIHFQHHPCLLGGRPSVADAGLAWRRSTRTAPGGPVPATLMKNRRAQRVPLDRAR